MNYHVILFATVFLVYSLKSFRFYFLFAGEGIGFLKYIRVFSITTLVNIIVPFKFGEIFRIVRFGHLSKNYLKGMAIVLLDRFVDTVSLLMIFASISILFKNRLGWIFFFLVIICVFLALCFFVLPGLIEFWNGYFITSRSSIRHLRCLSFLKRMEKIYIEIKRLIEGRFFLLFTISLLSWSVELCSIFLCRSFFEFSDENMFAAYLSAALTGNKFEPLTNFIIASIMFLSCTYVLALFAQLFKKLRYKNGR